MDTEYIIIPKTCRDQRFITPSCLFLIFTFKFPFPGSDGKRYGYHILFRQYKHMATDAHIYKHILSYNN